MGVWMEAESTVMTVSQGISRPERRKHRAQLFWPAEFPLNCRQTKLDGRERWKLGSRNHWQRREVSESRTADDDATDGVGSGLGGGGG